jgi:homoserine dehydrogenase
MKQYNLCFLGFGNVGRALARLFVAKSAELQDQYGIEFRVTGVASRRIGWLANSEGFDVSTPLANLTNLVQSSPANNISSWLQAARV